MDKTQVTRTFSIGAIGSGSKVSEDLFTARRHSSAGMRALLWATNSAKSFGCSTDSQSSRENIFPNILTPDSIPQFTIPSLSVQTGSLDKDPEENKSDGGLDNCGAKPDSSVSPARTSISSSTSSSSCRLLLSDRKAERSVSDPLTKRRSLLQREAQHCLDPASRAALSLPHLTKVTTPYGFITLGQSPQMASEEVLLCQAGVRRPNKDNEALSSSEDLKNKSSLLPGAKKRLSKDSADSQSSCRPVRGELQTSSASSSYSSVSSSTQKNPETKHKRRFYEVIRKHFFSRH